MGKQKKNRKCDVANVSTVNGIDTQTNRRIANLIRAEHPHLKVFSEAHLWTSGSCQEPMS